VLGFSSVNLELDVVLSRSTAQSFERDVPVDLFLGGEDGPDGDLLLKAVHRVLLLGGELPFLQVYILPGVRPASVRPAVRGVRTVLPVAMGRSISGYPIGKYI
jgi:hypothetical protein